MSERIPNRLVRAALAAMVLASLGACSAQQTYYAGQAWQRGECLNIIDTDERDRCIARTRLAYEDYRSMDRMPRSCGTPSH